MGRTKTNYVAEGAGAGVGAEWSWRPLLLVLVQRAGRSKPGGLGCGTTGDDVRTGANPDGGREVPTEGENGDITSYGKGGNELCAGKSTNMETACSGL